VQQGDLLGVAGEMDGGLPGRVGPADHNHALAGHGFGLGHSGAIEDSRAEQRVQPGDRQAAVADPGGDDDGPADRLAAVGQGEDPVGAA
jgi:hypothetical protein